MCHNLLFSGMLRTIMLMPTGKLVSGDRVRKKNLEAGAMYKFRIRFARDEGGK
jgi:hypothetical protein